MGFNFRLILRLIKQKFGKSHETDLSIKFHLLIVGCFLLFEGISETLKDMEISNFN